MGKTGNWAPDDAMEHQFEVPFDDAMGKLETLAMMKLGPPDDLLGEMGGTRPLILFKRFNTSTSLHSFKLNWLQILIEKF